ncbi:MAG: Rieske 2Fe-2S domain-containing protein [Pseudomonadales bacterium]|nr:Rieske 2Fe-2S domain-containing protein [Pseudomonadales bacterium]
MNLHEGYRRTLVIDRQQLLLIEQQGRRYVIQGSCPHLHWPLEHAIIQDDVIRCQKHNFAFNVNTGVIVSDIQQSCPSLRVYPIIYQGNTLGVYL